jgi:hypothetical protein
MDLEILKTVIPIEVLAALAALVATTVHGLLFVPKGIDGLMSPLATTELAVIVPNIVVAVVHVLIIWLVMVSL